MKRNILKKTIIVSLAATLAMGMCACGNNTEADGDDVNLDVEVVTEAIDEVDENVEEALNNGTDKQYKVTDANISEDQLTAMYGEMMTRAGKINQGAVVILNKSKEGYSFSIIIPDGTDADYDSVVEGYSLEKVN